MLYCLCYLVFNEREIIMSFFASFKTKIFSLFLAIAMLFAFFAPVESYTVKDEENLLMSFVSISDTHIRSYANPQEYKQATYLVRGLKDLDGAATKPDALAISGDITHHGKDTEYLPLATIFEKYPTPEYLVLAPGNHDFGNTDEGDYNEYRERFIENYNKITGRTIENPYYVTVIKGFFFIVLSSEAMAGTHQVFSEAQLYWLEHTLSQAEQQAPGKPIFVFNHNPLRGTNDVDTKWPSGGTPGAQSDEIMAILQQHQNVFFITGHLHDKLDEDRIMTIDNVHFVNTPCFHSNDDYGTGYVFEAYEDHVVIRARNLLKSKWRDFEYTIDLV